ncbi:hypothetical protein M146_4274 [Bacteroides fragilis str. 1007-1-F |nr:hypothetical protein M146_4274 [Bacteroides fragilis str. 1007-1-F \
MFFLFICSLMPEVHNFPTSCKSTKKTGSVGDILKKIIACVLFIDIWCDMVNLLSLYRTIKCYNYARYNKRALRLVRK